MQRKMVPFEHAQAKASSAVHRVPPVPGGLMAVERARRAAALVRDRAVVRAQVRAVAQVRVLEVAAGPGREAAEGDDPMNVTLPSSGGRRVRGKPPAFFVNDERN